MSDYHIPVLLHESVEGLNIRPDGVYVDLTFGGGSHSALILDKLGKDGKLFAFDQDADAKLNAIDDDRFTFIQANFRHLKRFIRLHQQKQIDGIIADLGISSHQIDVPQRGFSYRFDADLDMRMNAVSSKSAADVLNSYSELELVQVLSDYGEVRNSKTLARAIVQERDKSVFRSTFHLNSLLDRLYVGNKIRYFSQVYQALRIEVNEEMDVLRDMLEDVYDVLVQGGRLVVISYHSIEDRLVKNFIKSGNVRGEIEKDFYGNIERKFKAINKKVIEPDISEIKVNSRARSARLRIAEKI
jgi:16S rRNA (cytosine1402-N4)-methyltransferase